MLNIAPLTHPARTGRPLGKRLRSQRTRSTVREVAMKFLARTIAVMIAGIAGGAMSHAAELTVLASQSNLPGVNELATAFARTSGYKVTVLQETDKALEQRLSNGPADLVTGNPPM